MAKGNDYSASIIEINKALATKYSRNAENREFWADDSKVLELLKMDLEIVLSLFLLEMLHNILEVSFMHQILKLKSFNSIL